MECFNCFNMEVSNPNISVDCSRILKDILHVIKPDIEPHDQQTGVLDQATDIESRTS